MIALNGTTIAITLEVLGVLGTFVWYALAWHGIKTLKEMRDALSHRSSDNE